MAIAFEVNVIAKLFILAIVLGKTLLCLLISSYYLVVVNLKINCYMITRIDNLAMLYDNS